MTIFLIHLIHWIANLYTLILFIRILLSWVSPDPYNPVVQFIYKVTEPILRPIRRYLPLQWGMIDFSPILAFFLIQVVERIIVQLIIKIS